MGVFFEPAGSSKTDVSTAIRDALRTDPPADTDLDSEVQRRTRDVHAGSGKQLHKGHFSIALVFFLILVVAGVLCEKAGLGESTKYVFSFAGTVLAAILGILAGEGAAS